MESGGDWCLIESDPGVFTELIRSIHVQDTQVEEIYSLDDPCLHEDHSYGLIFLFKYDKSNYHATSEDIRHPPGLFFANQVINNACATQAILSILMNAQDLVLGQELEQFKEFTMDLPPDMKGLAISNSDTIRSVHNSFARVAAFAIADERHRDKQDDDEDLFHFVSFLPFQGSIYELDGLKPGPIYHGWFERRKMCDQYLTRQGEYQGSWVEAAKPIIRSRIERFSQSEIRFNLMAVIKDRTSMYKAQMNLDLKKLEPLKKKQKLDDGEAKTRSQLEAEMAELEHKIALEQSKMQRYKKENIRRRHNFLPFIMELLEVVSQTDAFKAKFPSA